MIPEDVPDHRYFGCRCTKASTKALLVTIPALGGDFWVPRRVICGTSEVLSAPYTGDLVVAGWFARRLQQERAERLKGAAARPRKAPGTANSAPGR